MANLDSALRALRSTIDAALATANITPHGQTIIGWPVATELAKIMGQDASGALVSIFPMPPSKNTTRYSPTPDVITAPSPGTIATLTNNTTVTISGSPKAGDTVHCFFSGTQADAAHTVTASDTTSTIASALAISANALAIPGVTATASGNALTLAGSTFVRVNVGGVGMLGFEVNRVMRTVMVTVWASTPNDPTVPGGNDRELVGEAILSAVGTSLNHWISTPDGYGIFIVYKNDRWSDDASDSYTLFRWDIFFDMEYPVTISTSATQVESVEISQSYNSVAPVTTYIGG